MGVYWKIRSLGGGEFRKNQYIVGNCVKKGREFEDLRGGMAKRR